MHRMVYSLAVVKAWEFKKMKYPNVETYHVKIETVWPNCMYVLYVVVWMWNDSMAVVFNSVSEFVFNFIEQNPIESFQSLNTYIYTSKYVYKNTYKINC